MARYIDADAFEVFGYDVPKEYDVESFGAGACCVLNKLDEQPTADVRENVHGIWIEDGYRNEPIVCSYCGEPSEKKTNFCPNCGADMRGKKDD